jgi:tetratricopeptide (TPR) repeat protein
MANGPGSAGAFESALGQVAGLLASDPKAAAGRASALLKSRPDHPVATLYLGIARRLMGDLPGALRVLGALARHRPRWAPAHYELGVTSGAAGRTAQALDSLQRAVSLQVDIGEAWLLIADHLIALGDPDRADAAYANHRVVSCAGPGLRTAAAAICENRLDDARAMLQPHLVRHPRDAAALRLLAETDIRARRYGEAEKLLRGALELAPQFIDARHCLVVALQEQNRYIDALAEVEQLLAIAPRNAVWLNLKANLLTRSGDLEQAIACFAAVIAEYPGNARIWMAYGDALKTAGRYQESVEAYRTSCRQAPGFGEAWWSLSNLKTFRFSTADVQSMGAQLVREELSSEDQIHFHFALGKAFEDLARWRESFAHYAEGNRIRRAMLDYQPEAITACVRRAQSLFTTEFYAERSGWGHASREPIFIIGLPRSGSTLIEQILASHSAVEGTMELPHVSDIANSLVNSDATSAEDYPGIIAGLADGDFHELAERYLRQARMHRRTEAALFVDKMPNNWMHVGLIHLMMPGARIIDVRRHPMGCCFSCFKQHFARGQPFTYSLEDIGRYYRDYAGFMSHIDTVLPGRVHRVHYERLIADTETEVRRLLDYCGLPYEAACLRFHETERAISTASSEQVRQPLYRDALDQWRNYEAWLGPLEETLGPLAADYPAGKITAQSG